MLAAFAAIFFATPNPDGKLSVSWPEVRAALGESICATEQPRSNGARELVAIVGDRAECGGKADTVLALAVDGVYEKARLLVNMVVMPKGAGAATATPNLTLDERSRLLREAYLSSEEFLRVILPRLRVAMTSSGLTCDKCPEFSPKPLRQTTWREFAPYVAAYVWPNPVRTPIGSDGKPSGKPKYGFHVCSGLNGVSSLIDPDPGLLHAAFLSAFGNEGFTDRVGAIFQSTLEEDGFLMLTDDESRTKYLRDRVPMLTVADPLAREAICHRLDEFLEDLGLLVSDCAPPVQLHEQ